VTPALPSSNPAADEGRQPVPAPGRAVIAFTFDDGYISDYDLAYPILKKYGIRGTSYIIGKFPDNNTPDTLSWAQIKEMAAWGWCFGCHTYNHVDMTTLSDDAIRQSLEAENQAFTNQGMPVPQIIAYPSGKYDQRVIDIVKQYRLQGRKAFYESKFVDLNNVDPYQIDSISADMQEDPRLKSREALVDKACEQGAVIVFRTHCMYREQKNDEGKWDVQTDSRLFAQLVKYCVDKNCEFVTMEQLMQMYTK
jgi:peptidoglycan/xylan/chitin deacetylase (PgdA/CDA1 family)